MLSQISSVLHICADWDTRLQQEIAAMESAQKEGLTRLVAEMNEALKAGNSEAAEWKRSRILSFLEVVKATSPLPGQTQEAFGEPLLTKPTGVPGYVTTVTALVGAHAYLTQRHPEKHDHPEWMLAVTGLKLEESLRTLETLIPVKLADQSSASAAFDMEDFNARVIMGLYKQGQALHGIFHSHPWSGVPRPSGVDWELQDLLEEGYPAAIQAVFSADGVVRFFARKEFEIDVRGKGVKQIDEQTFRIDHHSALSYPALGAARRNSRPLAADRGR